MSSYLFWRELRLLTFRRNESGFSPHEQVGFSRRSGRSAGRPSRFFDHRLHGIHGWGTKAVAQEETEGLLGFLCYLL